MKTAVEYLEIEMQKVVYIAKSNKVKFDELIKQAKEMEKEQAQLYAEFAILSDRSENPIIPFNEFINIDNL